MNYYEKSTFIGNWKLNDSKGTLSIEKTNETYKCVWKINKNNLECEYLGIGILADNRLFVSRFLSEVMEGGIGIYSPIGDLRSYSALWASTKNFDTLGSGIAIRNDRSEIFQGNYKVRYFIKENESPVYDLKILKKDSRNLYSLNWSINDEVKLHGVGMTHDKKMILAWGKTSFQYEVIILSIENKTSLTTKCTLFNSNIITENYSRC